MIYHNDWNFSKGSAWSTFQGRCKHSQGVRGGGKRSQWRCAPPHTSPQNPVMPYSYMGQCLPMWTVVQMYYYFVLFCFVFHSKQITLNETRDTLRETYKMVSDTLELLFSVPRPIFYNENYVWNCALRYRIQIPVLYSAMDSCGEWDTHYLKKNIQQNFNVSRESPSFEYLEWQFHYWLFFDIYSNIREFKLRVSGNGKRQVRTSQNFR